MAREGEGQLRNNVASAVCHQNVARNANPDDSLRLGRFVEQLGRNVSPVRGALLLHTRVTKVDDMSRTGASGLRRSVGGRSGT